MIPCVLCGITTFFSKCQYPTLLWICLRFFWQVDWTTVSFSPFWKAKYLSVNNYCVSSIFFKNHFQWPLCPFSKTQLPFYFFPRLIWAFKSYYNSVIPIILSFLFKDNSLIEKIYMPKYISYYHIRQVNKNSKTSWTWNSCSVFRRKLPPV